MRYTRVHRLIEIITLIQGTRGLKAPDLAAKCETGERNIYRDIDQLKEANVPIYFDDDTGGYLIRHEFFLRPVDLKLDEAMALLLLCQHIGGAGELAFVEPAGKAANKLLAILPEFIRNEANELLPHVSIKLARSQVETSDDVYARVQQAITDKRSLTCGYESPRRKDHPADATFRLDPYAIYFGQRAWYVVGKHHGHGDVRPLKLSRFIRCESSDQPYGIPDDWTLEKHFGKAWRMMPSGTVHDIELHFDPTVAETVADTHWHDSQDETLHDDGSTTLRFQVDGLEEIVWWILSYGPHCRVIKPPALKQRVAELIEAMAKTLSEDSTENGSIPRSI